MKHRLFFLLPVTLLASCASTPSGIQTLAFVKNYYELRVGESVQLNVSAQGEGNITYMSGNEDIVSLTKEGLLTALKEGEATVFAFANNLVAKAYVQVAENEEEATVTLIEAQGKFQAQAPAFMLNYDESFPVTFAMESTPGGRFYVSNPLPSGQLIQSLLALRNSPYFTANPDDKLPQGYEDFCSLLEKAKGKVTCQSFYEEGELTSYVYDDGKCLGSASFDLTEQADQAALIRTALSSVSFDELSTQDLLALIGAILDQGSIDTTDSGWHLAKSLLYHSDFLAESTANGFTATLDVHDTFSEDLFSYFAPRDFGTDPRILSASFSTSCTKKDGIFAWDKSIFDAKATLFGQTNEIAVSLTSTSRESKGSDYLDTLWEQAAKDAK